MPAVSIIVPVYNAERFLEQCVESIIAQSYADFELLLVDDGSKDRSGEICDQYKQKDSRVKVFHLPNGGVSKARNHGLNQAQGQYVTFADADDWLEATALETYVKNFGEGIDIVRAGYKKEGKEQKAVSTKSFVTDNMSEYFLETENSRYHAFVWNSMYKRELIGDQRFDESISFCEDHLFSYAYYLKCRKFCTLSEIAYHYRIQDSATLSDVQDAGARFKVAELDYAAKCKLNREGNAALAKRTREVYHRSVRKAIRTVYKNKNYTYQEREAFWKAFSPTTREGMFIVERIYAIRKRFEWIDKYFQLIY